MKSEELASTQERLQLVEAENARLQGRVEELERLLAERGRVEPGAPRTVEGISYETIFNALPTLLCVYRTDGTIVAFNDLNCRRFGAQREDVLGKVNVLANESLANNGYVHALKKAAAGEVARLPATEVEVEGRDHRIWVESTMVPIRDEERVKLVATVTVDLTEQKRAEEVQRRRVTLLSAVIQNASSPICVRDLEGRHVIVNAMNEAIMGVGPGVLIGKTLHEVLPADAADEVRAIDRAVIASRTPSTSEHRWSQPDGDHLYLSTTYPLLDDGGEPLGICVIATDITARVKVEERNRKLQEEVLLVQQETLRAISTPLIPIAQGVVVMPLVGEVTRERAEQVVETLLRGISEQQARIAILDVTGVPQAGAEVTEAILRAARSVKLLGAEVILTGVRPSVAQALIELGADLAGISTLGTLERGVAHALSTKPQAARGQGYAGARRRG
ncbi:PAS domain-containing protein [Chondromyces apiculatus]|uniref:RsbR, positive regulator of sigma-B n=1 Tax=Chondromyces apiculatus DSM 436 TaxID=1192034 RepID=A0A017T5S7_9BACT|nr:PAS domain-containing protein [Chondromyces apiculatus]EYF03941.1 RsbR, positive regulator of sigma-B [Chondromyces apiculatus DSM 436]